MPLISSNAAAGYPLAVRRVFRAITPACLPALLACLPALCLFALLPAVPAAGADDAAATSATFRLAAPDDPNRIAEVRFEGLKKLDPEDLMRIVESRAGTRLDRMALSGDLKRLGEKALSAEAFREKMPKGIVLTFVIKENPVLKEIRVIGNSQVKTATLLQVLRVHEGETLTREAVRKARDGAQKEYHSLGYMKAEVRADVVPLEEGKAALQVSVVEGDKIRTDKIVFEGNQFHSALRLKLALETKGSWLFLKNYFDDAAFERDLEVIREMYLKDGFFDAQVARSAFTFDEKEKVIVPRVRIVEGPRYRLGRVSAQGAKLFKPDELEAFFRRQLGEYFDRKNYSAALEKARRLYQDAGYLTTEIQDDLDFDRAKGEVRSTLTVQESPRIHIGKVTLERPRPLYPEKPSWFGRIYGYVAPPVRDKVIWRESRLRSGEVYEKRKEERAEDRLRRLEAFENVKVESVATDDPAVRDARISVEEGVTGNLYLGVGYSDTAGFYVWSAFSEKNVGGRADVLSASAEIGQRAKSGRVSYMDRHLGDSDLSMLYEIYHSEINQPGFKETRTGGAAELGVPLESLMASAPNDLWKFYIRGRGELDRTSEGEYHPEENFNRHYGVVTGRVRVTRDAITREKLDGKNFTESGGWLAGAGVEAGQAGGPLTKMTADLDIYQKIMDKWVFASEMQGGLMPVSANRVGPTERLYLGGTQDLRGFSYREAGPHDAGDHRVPLGGSTKLLARNEMRYPLFESVTGVLFLDAGFLDHEAFTLGEPRASSGVGIRVKVKTVELGIDLAVPFLTQEHDQRRFFHFNIRGGMTP